VSAFAEHFISRHPVCPHCHLPTTPLIDAAFDDAMHRIAADGAVRPMGALTWSLLTLLRRRPGMVFSNDAILQHLYGGRADTNPQGARFAVRHARQQLLGTPWRIKTVHGVGYMLVKRGRGS